MSALDGVLAVAGHEVRMRLRAGRWRWLLGLWVGVNLLFVVLLKLAIGSADAEDAGAAYGVYLFFVLALALLVVPALASTAVNGDRERGTLALLQVTRLRPWEIAGGKLAASAGTALVFWALTLPLVGLAVLGEGVDLGLLLSTQVVLVGLLVVVCALALGLSALLTRSLTSTLLAYVLVFALTAGSGIAFGLATALSVEEDVEQSVEYLDCGIEGPRGVARAWEPGDPAPDGCAVAVDSFAVAQVRTDRTWWLLAANPFVVLADAAGPGVLRVDDFGFGSVSAGPTREEPLAFLAYELRVAREGPGGGESLLAAATEVSRPDSERPSFSTGGTSGPERSYVELAATSAVWPVGLGVLAAAAAGAVVLTARRLEAPVDRLPRGQRVA